MLCQKSNIHLAFLQETTNPTMKARLINRWHKSNLQSFNIFIINFCTSFYNLFFKDQFKSKVYQKAFQ